MASLSNYKAIINIFKFVRLVIICCVFLEQRESNVMDKQIYVHANRALTSSIFRLSFFVALSVIITYKAVLPNYIFIIISCHSCSYQWALFTFISAQQWLVVNDRHLD